MITEDYVSFETAKLLKKKGFDEVCYRIYDTKEKELFGTDGIEFQNHEIDEETITAPTLQMACKWLREVHNLYIWIGHTAGKVLSWYYEIHGISDGKVKYIGGIQCGSYEVACEVAIKYSLENLI